MPNLDKAHIDRDNVIDPNITFVKVHPSCPDSSSSSSSSSTSIPISSSSSTSAQHSSKRRRSSSSKSKMEVLALQQPPQTISPYLQKHIPLKYNPHIANPSDRPTPFTMAKKPTYCNRHHPDAKCWRQANEPTMEELQKELSSLDQSDQQGISQVWSMFSTAPSAQRKLMLQGILSVCCFPELSYVADTVRDSIKMDFLSMLPVELSFKILGHLDSVSLCKAAQVSRRWNQLAEDDLVWHKMCEQHIAKKCKKCGWGLPLLDQKRLFDEKQYMKKRALSLAGKKRAFDEIKDITEIKEKKEKEKAQDSHQDSPLVSEERPTKKSWKEVYKTRFKISTNWKYSRYKLKVLKGHRNSVMCLDFQGSILATGSYDATIKIWDLDTGTEIRTLEGHSSGVRCVQFYNFQLFSGSMDKTIRVWNWETGNCVRIFNGLGGDILSVNFDSQYLASGSKDHKVRVWDFDSKKNYTIGSHSDFVNSVRIHGPSKTLFSAGDDGLVYLWDLVSNKLLKTFRGHVGGVQQVYILPKEFDFDESDLLDCEHNSDTEEEQSLQQSINLNNAYTRAHAQSNTNTNTNTNTNSNMQNHRNAKGSSPYYPITLPNDPMFKDQPSRPNPPQFILTASLDATIRLWHVPTERCLRTFFGHLEGIWSIAADNLRIVSAAEDRMIKIWDPRTGVCDKTFYGHTGPVTCVGLSGDLLVTGSEDREIRVLKFDCD